MTKQIFFVVMVICASLLFRGCDSFEYNVYETHRNEHPIEATNLHNIQWLQKLAYKDTLYVVFTGDPQRHYNELEEIVEAINQLPKLDAVFVAGDLVEYAFSREFEWVSEQLCRLKSPFLTVLGNHDCGANGLEIYQQIYGPLNYSFTWNKIRFVMTNTNSREFNFNGQVPDIPWMNQALADTGNYEHSLFMCHVPPYHEDFDKTLEAEYTQIVRSAKNTILMVNGHRHSSELAQPYADGIWYLNTSSPNKGVFAYVKIYTAPDASQRFDCTFIPF